MVRERFFSLFLRLVLAILVQAPAGVSLAQPLQPTVTVPTVAINYASEPPLDELRVFDIVVVDGDHAIDAKAYHERTQGKSQLFAYLAAGEALKSRHWYSRMPEAMRPGKNEVWSSVVIDQTHPDWPRFFTEEIAAPLWAKGYRGFFLDTMDSYQLIAKDSTTRAVQEAGLIRAIKALKSRFPEAKLIANRGFEVLPALQNEIFMIAAESLYQGWNHGEKAYNQVSSDNRAWLLDQLTKARDEFKMHALSIDYVAPHERDKQAATAKQILSHGIQAYVTDPELASIGTGRWQNIPRRILVLHDTDSKLDVAQSDAARFLLFPIHHLGYRADLVHINTEQLPKGSLSDRYAGVITWFNDGASASSPKVQGFMERLWGEKLKFVSFNQLPVTLESTWGERLGLKLYTQRLVAPIKASDNLPRHLGAFETEPLPRVNGFLPIQFAGDWMKKQAASWIPLRDAKGAELDGAGLTPWGAFALSGFTVYELPTRERYRWIVNPSELVKQGLRLPFIPTPDLSTESGRRMLMIHIDGDGYASRAEIPGSPFASKVMHDEFIAKYAVPHTVSIIEAEVAATGLYKALAPSLEAIARQTFALPNVELATHTYSHPFYWRDAINGATHRKNRLPLPGYEFSLEREFKGSAKYIESLAPTGKKTQMVLWSGDCVPPPTAIEHAAKFGLLNMNGGDTLLSKTNDSLTAVAPYGLRKGGLLQVHAPNQNENVYTNLWTGPFYGFDRVIETFEMSEKPVRLKPINIYYHTYSASKTGAINALHKVYQYAMAQRVAPIYGSEYARKVIDWEGFALSNDVLALGRDFRFASDGHMRTLRWPTNAVPVEKTPKVDFNNTQALAGAAHGPGFIFAHLSQAIGGFSLASTTKNVPFVIDSNGFLSKVTRSAQQFSFELATHVPPEFTLALPEQCAVTINNKPVSLTPSPEVRSPNPSLNAFAFKLASDGRGGSSGKKLEHNKPSTTLVSVNCR